jgi:hypothetical protein
VKKYGLLVLIAGLIVVGSTFVLSNKDSSAMTVVVYKSPTCTCCSKWVDHMRDAGFDVEVHDELDMNPIKAKNGVRPQYSSCHTAIVDGYVIEGHVPAEQIVRLLAERPEVLGLSAPGMPVGSPGMEVSDPSQNTDYDVVSFDGAGRTELYARIDTTP